jgi:hypothetical protein
MPNAELLSKLEDIADQVSQLILSISCWLALFRVLIPSSSTSSKLPTKNFTFSIHANEPTSPYDSID